VIEWAARTQVAQQKKIKTTTKTKKTPAFSAVLVYFIIA